MIALEHSLIMLLLLAGLLNARPRMRVLAQLAIALALGLAFVAPMRPLSLPWDWLSALAIPLLLWQTGRRLASARGPARLSDLGLWLLAAAGMGAMLLATGGLGLSGALLFGALAASMMWRATEVETVRPGHLGQLGPLALAFLLAEIAPTVEAPGRYLLGLAGGAAAGAVVGYAAVHLAPRTPPGRWRELWSVGQGYLAYAVGLALGVSGVASCALSIMVYVVYGARQGVWPSGKIQPQPLDSQPVFVLAVAALAFFGWQTHVPLTLRLLLEIVLGLLLAGAVVVISRPLRSPAFAIEGSTQRVVFRVGLLLVPALLLWPRELLLQPAPLAVALLTAGAVTLGAHLFLSPLLSLYAWLDEAGTPMEQADSIDGGIRVGELMTREVAFVSPDTPVPEVARLMADRVIGCVPVLGADGGLVGIITESDLFIRTERLPGTGQTYPALFKEPITPEYLLEVYAERGGKQRARDVMTQQVTWVKDSHSVSHAIRLMVHTGLKRLPVLGADTETEGRLVGILTRGDVIRMLTQEPSA